MTIKHTPWTFSEEDGLPIIDANNKRVCDMDCKDRYPNLRTNARLIAAAPDLLDALENVEEWMQEYFLDYEIDHDSREQRLMLKISSAIAKARGN